LKESGYFDIKIIYLFRNGQARLESNNRKAQKYGIKSYSKGPMSESLRFIKTHLFLRAFLKNNFDANRLHGLTYNDFTTNPKTEIGKILHFINASDFSEMISGQISFHKRHNIGGNRLRFRSIGKIEFREEWKNNLTKWEKFIYLVLRGTLINKAFRRYKS
jgi:hypothetical protein